MEEMDKDGDGKILKADLLAMIAGEEAGEEEKEMDGTRARVMRLMAVADADGDGAFDAEEVLVFVKA